MTKTVHQNDKFRNVGMIELVNEPIQDAGQASSMRSSYYPDAFKVPPPPLFNSLVAVKLTVQRIRDTETSLSVSSDSYLHVQMMNEKWGSGDPTESLSDTSHAAYDDHRYLKWDSSVEVNKDSYISASCSDDRGGNAPTIVGEWSLSVPDDVEGSSDWDPESNTDFYAKWFAAQVIAYEKQLGWVFWTWKAELDDYRWSYKGMSPIVGG